MKNLLAKYTAMSQGDQAALFAFGSMALNVVMAFYNVYIWYFSKTYLFLVMCFYYMLLAIMRFFAAFSLHLFFKKPFNDFIKIMLQVCGAMMMFLGLILALVVLSRAGKPAVTLDNWMAWGYGALAVFKTLMVLNGSRQAKRYQDVLYSLVQRIGLVETTLTIYTFFQAILYTYPAESTLLSNISMVIGLIAVGLVVVNGYQTVRYDPRYYDAVTGIFFHKKGKIEGVERKKERVVKPGTVVSPWKGDTITADRNAKVAWTAHIEEQLKEMNEASSEEKSV